MKSDADEILPDEEAVFQLHEPQPSKLAKICSPPRQNREQSLTHLPVPV